MSQSALVKRLVEAALITASTDDPPLDEPPKPLPANGRISVRLRPDDLLLLRERAKARSMASSAYVTFLVRGHLRSLTPLPTAEFMALRKAVMEVAAIGRNFNQMARALNAGERSTGPDTSALQALLRALTALRDRIRTHEAGRWDMTRRVINLGIESPLLDIGTYGRAHVPLTPARRAHIALTVRRVPEVIVKVSGGARSLHGVETHMAYIGRDGELALEMDTGEVAVGKGIERQVVADWNLSVDANRSFTERSIQRREPPKLVHNLIFSMPAGTPGKKVLEAVRKLALNKWQLKHRYGMALHTDSGHPHVHVALMAVGEDGQRLNIRKATLRSWRAQFAENLRELGIAANATERAVRGLGRTRKTDGIYRAAKRGVSTHVAQRITHAAKDLYNGKMTAEKGREALQRTRAAVLEGWRAVASKLRAVGDHDGADQVRSFLGGMPAAKTEKEILLDGFQTEARPRPDRGHELTR